MTENETPAGLLPALQTVAKAASAYSRPDLEGEAKQLISELNNPGCYMVVAGEFKQGKSSLVNGLLNAALCPVDDDIATAIPTFIRFGETTTAHAHRGGDIQELDGDSLRSVITGKGVDGSVADVVEVKIKRQLLAHGLVIIDTPGVGGLDSLHGARTLAALNQADAVLFVSDASQELTASEATFLKKAYTACSTVAVVMPKTDLYPHWRQVTQLTTGHLESLDINGPVFPVSSPLRSEALRDQSAPINVESGYQVLVEWVQKVSDRSEAGRVSHAISGALDILHQLTTVFEAERAVLKDPSTSDARLQALTDASAQVEALRVSGGRWRQVLSDGIADISSEASFNLRSQLKSISDEGVLLIDDNNPLSMWSEFEESMVNKVQQVLVENVAFLQARSQSLAIELDNVFALEEQSVDVANFLDTSGFEVAMDEAEAPKGSIGGTALNAVRGSYSGILMFNMIGGLVGLSAIAPISISLGVVLGIKALKGEKDKRLTIARQSGKQTFRTYLDAATNWGIRETQDTVKQVQRTLRDTFADRLRLLQRTATESLAAAKTAAGATGGGQKEQLSNVEAELKRIEALRLRLSSLSERAE